MAGPGLGSARMWSSVCDACALFGIRQKVLHPIERSSFPHGRSPGPVDATRRSRFVVDFLLAEFDRLKTSVYQYFYARGYRGAMTEVVRRRHALDDKAGVVAPSDSADGAR